MKSLLSKLLPPKILPFIPVILLLLIPSCQLRTKAETVLTSTINDQSQRYSFKQSH